MGRKAPTPPPRNFMGTSRQPRKLIFGVQPYLNPTRLNMQKEQQLGCQRRRRKNKGAMKYEIYINLHKKSNDNLTRNKTISTPIPK
jgi:hypothetical protein